MLTVIKSHSTNFTQNLDTFVSNIAEEISGWVGSGLYFADSKATFAAVTLKYGIQLHHFFTAICITPWPPSQHSQDTYNSQSPMH